MSMIPEVKCRRCGETFSSMRSRCPNCGTRRVTQSSRTPGATPGTVRGTPAYERAETNTKWQLIFGLILVVAVILAVIVMVTTSLEGMDSQQVQSGVSITPPLATEYVPEIESAPTPPPTPTPNVEGIRVMFYTTELETEFTMKVGESVDLTAQVMPLTLEGVKVEWESSDEEYLVVQTNDDLSATVTCLKDVAGGRKLKVSCLGYEKELTVYLRPAD